MKLMRYIPGVATLTLDEDLCIGCGMCDKVCPQRVFELHDRSARIVELDACMECGACSLNCPVGAIHVNPGVGCAAYIVQKWLAGTRAERWFSCC